MSAFLAELPAVNAVFNGITAVCLLAGASWPSRPAGASCIAPSC